VLPSFLIAATHFLLQTGYSFEILCLLLSWISIPLFCCLNRELFVRCLPFWLIFLWCLNLLQGLLQLWGGCEFSGLPSNRNWQAALLLVSTPLLIYFLFFVLRMRLRLGKILTLSILALPLGLSLFLFWRCESRGGWLALGVCGVLAGFFFAGKYIKQFFGIMVLIGFIFAGWMLVRGSDSLAQKIAEDVRVPLWEGTIGLIADHPLIGVGQASFESEFATYRSGEYFMRRVAAARTNNPHNHFLYIAASFGLIGFFAWGILLLYPLCLFWQRRSEFRKKPLMVLFFFAFLALLTHGMFDLVLDEWPTNIAALLLLGFFWGEAWPIPNQAGLEIHEKPFFFRPRWIFPAFLLFALCGMLFCTAAGSYYYRNGLLCSEVLRDKAAAACFFEKSIGFSKQARPVYSAFTNASQGLDNPFLALRYARILREETPCRNFGHNNGFTGYNLGGLNRHREALPYLAKEVANFPIGICGWYNLFINQMVLGMRADAEESRKAMLACLKIKGLTEEDLALVLKNPEFDLHPWEIPSDSRKTHE